MMINHYFKVALRLIKRSFLFSSIHILGFVWGMAAAFLIYLWVIDELKITIRMQIESSG